MRMMRESWEAQKHLFLPRPKRPFFAIIRRKDGIRLFWYGRTYWYDFEIDGVEYEANTGTQRREDAYRIAEDALTEAKKSARR